MDRSPSPPVPQLNKEAQPSTKSVYDDPENFMEQARLFTGQTAPTDAAAAAQRGAIVRMLPLEPVQQQHLAMLPTARAPGPRAPGPRLQLTLAQPVPWENLGPCVTNMAPDPRSLASSSSSSSSASMLAEEVEMDGAEEVEMEEANEVEMENAEEVEAIMEGRFYLLPAPQNGGADEPKLLILFPLAPSLQ